MKSYSAWLHLSLFCVGLPALVVAWLGWQILIEAQYRLERGRIASDIYAALTNFDLSKARLRNWTTSAPLAKDRDPAERQRLLSDMRDQAAIISDQINMAIALDQQRRKVLQEHEEREALVALLSSVIKQLENETAADARLAPGPAVNRLASDDASLASALSLARRNEAVLLLQERARADAGLSAAQRLFVSAGGLISILTVLLAVLLSRRLRTPLQQLSTGVQAFQAGDFSYRLQKFRDAEFSRFAEQLNTMAAEVQQSRMRAADQRLYLENMVAERTADLRLALDRVSVTEATRKQLLADIGHELRTPVTVLQGEAQIALRARETDTQFYRDSLARIVTVTRDMGGLIDNLLEVVRDAELPDALGLRPTPLPAVMGGFLEIAQSLAVARQVTILCPTGIPDPSITTDPDRLRQVLVCLVDNAIRYSHEGGTVTVKCQVGADNILSIQITDAGIGIDPADIAAIWDRNWRAEAARNHRPEGLGLGLAIARKWADALGGRITIKSAGLGLGTTAEFQLPVQQGDRS